MLLVCIVCAVKSCRLETRYYIIHGLSDTLVQGSRQMCAAMEEETLEFSKNLLT